MKNITRPLLLIGGVIICLIMVRLGVWQLGRADEKLSLVEQRQAVENSALIELGQTIQQGDFEKLQRYQPVTFRGQYVPGSTIFVDNKVLNSKVGYQVFSTVKLISSNQHVVVGRGWVSNQGDRSSLPLIETNFEMQLFVGRVNLPPAKPPLWDDDFAVNQGVVWQYLPLVEYSKQLTRPVLPVVVELAPESGTPDDQQFLRVWQSVSDADVGKHKAYALQWFAMALTLFVIGLIMLIKSLSNKTSSTKNT